MRTPQPRPYSPNYPASAVDVIDPRARYKPAALRALRSFRRSKPWRGTRQERMEKFRQLNRELADAYGMRRPLLSFRGDDAEPSGNSSYSPLTGQITLRGRLSVVTYLHEFAHARGYDERDACYWSINLFRRVFPRSFARCRFDGHMLVQN